MRSKSSAIRPTGSSMGSVTGSVIGLTPGFGLSGRRLDACGDGYVIGQSWLGQSLFVGRSQQNGADAPQPDGDLCAFRLGDRHEVRSNLRLQQFAEDLLRGVQRP